MYDRRGGGRRVALLAAAALSIAAILAATLTPGPPGIVTPTGFCIVCGSTGGQDFFDNVLLFVPLAFFLRQAGARRWVVLAAAVLLTCLVEGSQYRVIAGRDASVGDVVANSLGGAVGLLLVDGWRRVVFPAPRFARWLAAAGALGWLAALAVTAWALGVAPLSDARRTVSFAPIDPRWSVFHGEVLGVRLDDHPLSPGPLPARVLADVRELVRSTRRPRPPSPYHSHDWSALRLEAVVTNGNERATFAPIVRIAASYGANDPTGDGDETVALGENGCDLEYHVRLRASALRLPSPTVSVPRVFPCGDGTDAARGVREGDTTLVAGGVAGGKRLLVIAGGRDRELWLSPSLGWSFFLPWRYPFGLRPYAALSALWLGGLLLPVGYWAGRGWRGVRRAGGVAAVVGVAVVAVGLAGTAAASNLTQPGVSDWLASLAGLGVGWVIGARAPGGTDGSRGVVPTQ